MPLLDTSFFTAFGVRNAWILKKIEIKMQNYKKPDMLNYGKCRYSENSKAHSKNELKQ